MGFLEKTKNRAKTVLGGDTDPTGSTPRLTMIRGGAGGGHDRSTVSFPDKTQFLDAPAAQDKLGMLPWGAQAAIVEGNQQIKKQAEIARRDIEPFAAKVSGLTHDAKAQSRNSERARLSWEKARARLDHAQDVLTDYVLHHGKAWVWHYVLIWVLLIVGDIAGGSLVLIKAGEEPTFAALLMTAVGTAAVTSAKIADDFRRRLLWLRHHNDLPDNADDRRLITNVFTYGDEPYQLLGRVALVVVFTTSCLAIGTLTVRLSEDHPLLALGFGFWAAGIIGGSFVNAWFHTDPAHTTLRNFEHHEKAERSKHAKQPTDAVEQRATNERAIAERLRSHLAAASALWYTKLAEAADICAANPQLAGHGTDGLSFLWKIRPDGLDDFEVLTDTHQVPLGDTADPITLDTADTDVDVDVDVRDDAAAITNISTRLTGFGEPAHLESDGDDHSTIHLDAPADLDETGS